jgi:hypothetical protein
VQAIGQFQSGRPISHDRNIYFNGDLSVEDELLATRACPFDISGFYFHDAAVQTGGGQSHVTARRSADCLVNNVRYFPRACRGCAAGSTSGISRS